MFLGIDQHVSSVCKTIGCIHLLLFKQLNSQRLVAQGNAVIDLHLHGHVTFIAPPRLDTIYRSWIYGSESILRNPWGCCLTISN